MSGLLGTTFFPVVESMAHVEGGTVVDAREGAALWDFFAAHALAGMMADASTNRHSEKDIAMWAGGLADAMLEERRKRM